MAKLMGVKVNEFAIGMGPRLFQFGKKETVYSLRAFPIGGFCAMEGEDDAGGGSVRVPQGDEADPAALPGEGEPMEVPAPDPRSFAQKKVWRRILIVVAGALMNLVLGYVALLIYYGVFTQPAAEGQPAMFSSTTIAELPETATSYQSGLRVGDEILKIDGKHTVTDFDVSVIMQNDEDGVFDFTVRRKVDGKPTVVELKKVTFDLKIDEQTGARQLIYDFKVLGIRKTVLSTLSQSLKMEYSVGVMIWRSLGDIITGRIGLNELSGPVGVVDAIGDAAVSQNPSGGYQMQWDTLLMLVVMITVNVGIFNLLPLPALDGGRLIFLLFEAIFRRSIPAKYEGWVHAIGLGLLFLLMIFVTFSDIRRIFFGG